MNNFILEGKTVTYPGTWKQMQRQLGIKGKKLHVSPEQWYEFHVVKDTLTIIRKKKITRVMMSEVKVDGKTLYEKKESSEVLEKITALLPLEVEDGN